MQKKSLFLIICGVFWAGVAAANPASKMEILGTYDYWTAYTFKDNEGKVCYMATEPTKSVGKYTVRGDIFLIVTHRMSDKTFDVVNVSAGYTYQKSSSPSFKIDNKAGVSLVSHADTAWARDAKTDAQLVQDMRRGGAAVLKGTSQRGTLTTDTFSLKGFSKAYQAIQKACGRE